MDNQGILSIDLLLTTFVLLLIITSTCELIYERFDMLEESQELVEARSLAEKVAGPIDQVYAAGDGHSIKIKMPAQIGKDSNYKVIVDSSGVLVDLEGRLGLAYIIPEKFSASSDKLESSTITLYPNKDYVIINKKKKNGDNWIVIYKV